MKVFLFNCPTFQKNYSDCIPVTEHLTKDNYKRVYNLNDKVIYAKYLHINTARMMETCFVPVSVVSQNLNVDNVPEPIEMNEYLEYILSLNNGYLLLFNSWEFLKINKNFRDNLSVLLKKLKIPLEKVIISSAYFNYKSKKTQFKAFGYDWTLLREKTNLKTNLKINSIIEPEKYFTFLNRKFTQNRFDTLKFIYENKFEKLGNVSFLSLPPEPTGDPIEQLLPIKLDGDFNSVDWETPDKKLFNSYFLIVNETITDSKIIFLSEKIYKGIRNRKPFIVFGVSGVLSALRSHGFKTFSPFINENYDEEKDYDKRFEMFLEQIKFLCNKTKEEITDFKKLTDPIVEHNYNLLKTKDCFEEFWEKII